MPLRLLARAAPIVLAAVAAAIWLRRRARRAALGQRSAGSPSPEPRPVPALVPAVASPAVGLAPVPAADPPAAGAAPARAAAPPRPRTGRFERSPAAPPARREAPLARAPERRSIDIVTVVDDLLGAPR